MKLDAIWQQETQQQMFRVILEALSRPGSVQSLPTSLQKSFAGKALLAVLVDGEVTLCDRHALLAPTDWRLLQVERADAGQADYVFCDGSKAPDFEPCLGSLPCPDRSSTIILKVCSLLGVDIRFTCKGPGIETAVDVGINGLNAGWLESRRDWVCSFPLGVDIFMVDDAHILGLPRTTAVEVR